MTNGVPPNIRNGNLAKSESTFRMDGARELLTLYPGAILLEQQVKAVEDSIAENPGLAPDLAKAIIETVCKTVLKDKDISISPDMSCPKLLKETLKSLRITLPEDEKDESLRKTVGSLGGLVQGICELRNKGGIGSHGKDAYSESIELTHACLAARAADAIVNFIFKIHKAYPLESSARIHYGEQTDFNEYVDELHEIVRIFDYEYKPSEVLFSVDYEAYRDRLIEFGNRSETDEKEQNEA